jgi:mitogen-activated protein kinase kinase kinase
MRAPPLQSPPSNGYTNLISPGGDPYPRPQSAFGNSVASSTPQRYQNRYLSNDANDSDALHSPHAMSPLRQGAINGRLAFGRDEGTSISQSTGRHALRLNPNALGTYISTRPSDYSGGPETPRTPPRSPASPRSPRHSLRPTTAEAPGGLFPSTSGSSLPNDIDQSVNSNATLRQENQEWIRQILDNNSNNSATLIPKAVDIGQSPIPVPPLPPLPPIASQAQNHSPYSPSQSTVVPDESDSDDSGTLWQKRPAPKSPQSKLSPEKSLPRGPPLTLTVPPSSFRGNVSSKGPEHLVASRPAPDPPHSERRLAPLTPNSGKLRQRGSTFTDNEYTWAPRPAAEEVYDRLEDFFPEHDLDMPVIEATSGTGSPTTAEYSAAPPVPEKDKPEKGLTRGKKSIRIVAEEHKKRIDRTSRPDNLANVLRKRSTKLWGSRLEEVTTEQAKAEYARVLYKPAPAPESPSGGPRRKWQRCLVVLLF